MTTGTKAGKQWFECRSYFIHVAVNVNVSRRNMIGKIQVSGKLPSYPSPKPTLSPTSHLGQNVGLGEGQVVN